MNGIDMGMNGISKPVQTWTKSDINKTSDRVLRKNRDVSGNSIITRIAIYMIEQDCQLLLSGQTVGNCPCFIGGYDMVLNQTIFYATIE